MSSLIFIFSKDKIKIEALAQMDTLIKQLEGLGLSNSEAKTYVVLLHHGSLTVQELSDLANIPRTRIYGILRRLQSQKLVETVVQDGQKRLVPAVPIVLSEKVREDYEKALKNAESLVQELLKIYHQTMQHKTGDSEGTIKIYKSPQKALEFLEKTIIDKDAKEIWVCNPLAGKKIVHRPKSPPIPPDEKITMISTSGQKVHMRWISPYFPDVKEVIQNNFTYRFGGPPEQFEPGTVEIRIVDNLSSEFSFPHFVVLDKKFVMSVVKEPRPHISLFIDDTTTAQIFAHYFDYLWEQGIPYEEL